MSHVIWTQWDDLEVPAKFKKLAAGVVTEAAVDKSESV
jgi:hypothetical protein